MKKLKLIILFFFIKSCFASLPTIYALHINGINTTQEEAFLNLKALSQVANINSNMIHWNIVYNPTASKFFSNLFDVMGQKAHEDQAVMSLQDFTLYWEKVNNLTYPINSPEFIALESQISGEYAKQLDAAGGNNDQYIRDEFYNTVPEQFSSVVDLLKPFSNNYSSRQAYVLLIPHSQGNLYANNLYTYLTNVDNFNPDNIAIYSIATPANINVGDDIAKTLAFLEQQSANIKAALGNVDSYLTSTSDYVVNGARVLFDNYSKGRKILPANFNINLKEDSGLPLGHNLIQVYLTDPSSSAQIAKMIHLELLMLLKVAQGAVLSGKNSGVRALINNIGEKNVLQGPTFNIVCQAGVCDPNVMYFYLNDIEKSSLIFGKILSIAFLPADFFQPGTYTMLGRTDCTQTDYDGMYLAFPHNARVYYNEPYCTIDDNGQINCTNNIRIIEQAGYTMTSSCSHLENLNYIMAQLPYLFDNNLFIEYKVVIN